MSHAPDFEHTDAAARGAHAPHETRARGPVRTHSGEGHLVANLLTFAFCMILLLASFWAFGLWISDSSATLPFVVAILLYALTFLIPLGILRSKTAKRSPGGTELTQL